MRSRLLLSIFVSFLMLSPASVSAQTPAAMTEGRTSLAIDIPDSNTGRISVWRFVSDRTNIGAVLGFHVSSSSNGDARYKSVGVDVGPAMKRYLSPRARVAPFIRADAGFGFNRVTVEGSPNDYSQTYYTARVGTGLGVDWFATDDISIGAHTGIFASWNQEDEQDRSGWNVSTFSSALTLHIYF
jgi:hypothetical protein